MEYGSTTSKNVRWLQIFSQGQKLELKLLPFSQLCSADFMALPFALRILMTFGKHPPKPSTAKSARSLTFPSLKC